MADSSDRSDPFAHWPDPFPGAGWVSSDPYYATGRSMIYGRDPSDPYYAAPKKYSYYHDLISGNRLEERIEAVYAATILAERFVGPAILEATGCELREMLRGIIPGLLMAMGVLAGTAAFGAIVGGLLGSFALGMGAVPGAVWGTEIGFEAGTAVVGYLGLTSLVDYIGTSLLEGLTIAVHAVMKAWHAIDHPGREGSEVLEASQQMAEALAVVFRGILQGLVAYLIARGTAAAAIRAPELAAKLRASRLGKAFGDWVETNWKSIVENPKLQPERGAIKGLGGGKAYEEPPGAFGKKSGSLSETEGGKPLPEEPAPTPAKEGAAELPPDDAAITGEPVNAITGEVIVEKRDFTLPGRMPIVWTRFYGSRKQRFGACGHGWQTPADARLTMKESGRIVFNDGSPRGSVFASLPGDSPVREAIGGALLSWEDGLLAVRMKSGLTYHFPVPKGEFKEVPASRIIDGRGNWVRFSRTSEGLSQILSSSGERIQVHSKDGLIRTMELHPKDGPPRLLVRYEYNEEDDLTAVYDALGKPLRYAYVHHRMIRHTDRNGLTFHYSYDSKGRCVHTRGDGGLYEYRFTYHEGARKTSATDARGNTWLLRYDENNLLLGKTDPLGHETRYEYNPSLLVSAVIDPLGKRTEYDYDPSGNVTAIRRPEGTRVEIAYDGSSRPVRIKDPAGHVWKQEWNEKGLLVKRTSPKGAETLYEYDELGGLISVTDPLGGKTRFELNPNGAPLAVTDALGSRTVFTLDGLGNLLSITDPTGAKTSYRYDAKSQLTRVIRPTGTEVSLAYDSEGNLTLFRDEAGNETRLEYTGTGEVSRRINPDGTTVSYRYDAEERLREVVNERGETFRLNRDAAGRVIEQIDYWGNPTRCLWDASGRLEESMDALGRTTRFQYDPLDRLTRKIFSDGTAEKFSYDPNGNLILHENGSSRVERLFDEEGRLIEERQGSFSLRNEYDLKGNRVRRKTSHGNEVVYTYDPVGRLSGIGINGGSVSAIKRNALGLPIREGLSDSLRREYAYDLQGRLTRQALFGTEAEVRSDYEYDAAGNLVAKKDASRGNTFFTYDPCGRVTHHIDPEGRIREYLYDPAGDLVSLKAEAIKLESEGKKPFAGSSDKEEETYRFDALGNLVKRGSQDFIWDGAGRLKSAQLPDGAIVRMSYDALGRRTAKATDGGKTIFAWDGDRLLSDCIQGEKPREFVYYPGTFKPFAMIEGDGRICYYNNDVVGLPQEVCDAAGNLLWSARYDALGKVEAITTTNGFDNPLRLQGQYFDPELNLHYNRHRYFDPDSCSFISKDPLGLAAGANLYAYAPNVWSWVDPLGLCKETSETTAIQKYFPDNNGFIGVTERKFLMEGDMIDRFGGSDYSRFFSPSGTPEAARSLPTATAGQPLRTFEVLKPFEVEAGTVAPAFGQPGLGTQFRTPVQMRILIDRGIIREITP
jgi:RHS repeat-associated protein